MVVRTASGVLARLMLRAGFAGWTSFWRVVYVLPGHEHNERLLRHELAHLEQIERDGRILFALKYSWWTLRRGYWMNPYEIEARAAELIHPSRPTP